MIIVCPQCQQQYEHPGFPAVELIATTCLSCHHERRADLAELQREALDRKQREAQNHKGKRYYMRNIFEGWQGRNRIESNVKRVANPFYPVRFKFYCGKCGLLLAQRATIRGINFKCNKYHENFSCFCSLDRNNILIEDLQEPPKEKRDAIPERVRRAKINFLLKEIRAHGISLNISESDLNRTIKYILKIEKQVEEIKAETGLGEQYINYRIDQLTEELIEQHKKIKIINTEIQIKCVFIIALKKDLCKL